MATVEFPAYVRKLATNARGEAEITLAVPFTDVDPVMQGMAKTTGWLLGVRIEVPEYGTVVGPPGLMQQEIEWELET